MITDKITECQVLNARDSFSMSPPPMRVCTWLIMTSRRAETWRNSPVRLEEDEEGRGRTTRNVFVWRETLLSGCHVGSHLCEEQVELSADPLLRVKFPRLGRSRPRGNCGIGILQVLTRRYFLIATSATQTNTSDTLQRENETVKHFPWVGAHQNKWQRCS